MLEREELRGAFSSLYLLPSLYHSDLDRGFCVVDYDLNEALASRGDLDRLGKLGIDLKLDFVLNHASVMSPQFQDLLAKGVSEMCKVIEDMRKEERIEVALRMLEAGKYVLDESANISGLPLDEVKKLQAGQSA